MRRSSTLALLVPFLAAAALSACGDDDGGTTTEAPTTTVSEQVSIAIMDPWARIATEDLGASYFTIVNGTPDTIRLTAASSSSAESVEIHETTMGDDGMMSMAEVEEGFEIPAGEELVLEPGGKHLMLIGFAPGDAESIELSLDFDGTIIEVTAPIDFEASGTMMGGMDSGGMDSEEMDSGDMDDDSMETDDESMGSDDMVDTSGVDMLLMGIEWDDGDLDSIVLALDVEALHTVDDDLNDGIMDPEMQLAVAKRALAVVQTAMWPIDVDPSELEAALVALVEALEAGDLETAAAAATDVHDLSHDLEPMDSHSS